MRGIVITGGNQPPYDIVKPLIFQADYIVAADSGLDYCRAHSIHPDYIIGDMDSLDDKSILKDYSESMIERHPVEKDYTDTELGLQHLYSKGCESIVLLGGGGGRADHFLAIYALFHRKQKPDYWLTHNSLFSLVQGESLFEALEGDEISLFPLFSTCRMKSEGLYWPLDELEWHMGDFGISNRVVKNPFSIKMEKGELLMIQDLTRAILPS